MSAQQNHPSHSPKKKKKKNKIIHLRCALALIRGVKPNASWDPP